MATLSTGEVCKRLGFMINAAFIERLEVEPVEIVKGHPRWSEDNFKSICAGIVDHVAEIAMVDHVAPATIKRGKATPKPAAKVDDDDEL